jgi:hypothetical protein
MKNYFFICLLFPSLSMAQFPDTGWKKWVLPVAFVSSAAGSLFILGQKWYKEYPSTSFHFANDMDHWQLMDKCGHAWSAYNLTRLSIPLWQQTGIKHVRAVLFAGAAALSYQAAIEVLDGYSAKWGFSWGDMGANILGVSTCVLQEKFFNKQILHIKIFSAGRVKYEPALRERAEFLFGKNFTSRLLNDYNAQTYWASVNIKDLVPRLKVPAWFNIAIGYGAHNMLGETNNSWMNKGEMVDRSDLRRYGRVLLSPDIDLSRIKTKKAWVKTLLLIANAIKIPAPALEYNRQRGFRMHALLF